MPCFSHPNKLLIDHLNNVKGIGLKVFDSKSNLNFQIDRNEIREALALTLQFHDFGKATSFFQDYLRCAVSGEEATIIRELTWHSKISAVFTAYQVYQVIKDEKNRKLLSIVAFIAVSKHHGNLDSLNKMLVIGKEEWRILEKQWNKIDFSTFQIEKPDFKETMIFIDDFLCDFLWDVDKINKDLDLFFLTNLFFSILTYSDKSEVIFGKSNYSEMPDNIENLVTTYKREKFTSSKATKLNETREELYNICGDFFSSKRAENIFSINIPTGSGKTLTVINAALKILSHDNSVKRIIYALPFTSIIDQTSEIIDAILTVSSLKSNEILTIHHHLAEIQEIEDENISIIGDKAQFIVENWDRPFILTTFWQLFYSIISNKNSQLRKFNNIADSIIILDEIQTVPYKYWELINKLLTKAAETLNCKIILLTATMPLLFLEEKNEITPVIEIDKRKSCFSEFSRYTLKNINNLEDISIKELNSFAFSKISENPDKNFLFVFNTIKTSLLFFDEIRKSFPDNELIYLSTNILPIERRRKIEQIKNSSKRKIVVSTQLIEAGVDIDMDIVFRDFAPLDSIVQTAGRCNRNNRQIEGSVYIFRLKNEKGQNDCNYIYKGITLDSTFELFRGQKEVKESQLLDFINQYYNKIEVRKSDYESSEILKNMSELNYEQITKDFQLIDDEQPSTLVFVEKDENASKVWSKLEEISKNADKDEFIKIKRELFDYILSVRTKKNKEFINKLTEEIKGIKILRHKKLSDFYDNETGLIL
jgi:CRISPR-associated endonuclease/helicase Cas3